MLTKEQEDKLKEESKAEYERCKKIREEQNALITRIMSIMTEEEKKDIPPLITSLLGGDWSPATVNSAIRFIKSIIGEDHKMRVYLAEKAIKFWDDHPEVHF